MFDATATSDMTEKCHADSEAAKASLFGRARMADGGWRMADSREIKDFWCLTRACARISYDAILGLARCGCNMRR
jgi:hypothetical protein